MQMFQQQKMRKQIVFYYLVTFAEELFQPARLYKLEVVCVLIFLAAEDAFWMQLKLNSHNSLRTRRYI